MKAVWEDQEENKISLDEVDCYPFKHLTLSL